MESKILDVIDLGDELAIGLGVHVEKERKMLFFYATALAALATSVAGNLAFLGLLGPHYSEAFSRTRSSTFNSYG